MSNSNLIDIQKLVNRFGDDCFEAHRGAFWWDESKRIAIVFGNDGYKERRAKEEVNAIRKLLKSSSGKELAFATTEDEYSWALACELGSSLTPRILSQRLWQAWNFSSDLPDKLDDLKDFPAEVGEGFVDYQIQITESILERNGLI